MYSKFGIIHIPQATFLPNFVSFTASIAELPHGKNRVLTCSLTQLIWCPVNRSFHFGIAITKIFWEHKLAVVPEVQGFYVWHLWRPDSRRLVAAATYMPQATTSHDSLTSNITHNYIQCVATEQHWWLIDQWSLSARVMTKHDCF